MKSIEVMIEEMSHKIESYYEPHAILFYWIVEKFKDRSEFQFKIFVSMDYPLSNKIRIYVLLFKNKKTVIKKITMELMSMIDEDIKKGAKNYGY